MFRGLRALALDRDARPFQYYSYMFYQTLPKQSWYIARTLALGSSFVG